MIEQSIATPGGRFHVRWDEGGSATALGQLPFFAGQNSIHNRPGIVVNHLQRYTTKERKCLVMRIYQHFLRFFAHKFDADKPVQPPSLNAS